MHQYVTDFIEHLEHIKKYSQHTVTAYKNDIIDFMDFINDYNGDASTISFFSQADTVCFRSYLANRQRRGLSPVATARALSSLRSFYRFLSKYHNIKNDAIGLISSPRVPRKLSKAIAPIDIENMHDAIK
jgi:integrase/recombinase XerC